MIPRTDEAAEWLATFNRLYTAEIGSLLSAFDLTQVQYAILTLICDPKRGAGMRISSIAEAVDVGQPAVTKVVAKFEAQQLVSVMSDASDRRARLIKPTDFAFARLREVELTLTDRMSALWSALPPERLAPFTEDLRALASWLNAKQED